jgi:hypothetical protein
VQHAFGACAVMQKRHTSVLRVIREVRRKKRRLIVRNHLKAFCFPSPVHLLTTSSPLPTSTFLALTALCRSVPTLCRRVLHRLRTADHGTNVHLKGRKSVTYGTRKNTGGEGDTKGAVVRFTFHPPIWLIFFFFFTAFSGAVVDAGGVQLAVSVLFSFGCVDGRCVASYKR